MALFLISCVDLETEVGYRIVEHTSREVRVYTERNILSGLNSGVKIENMYLQNGALKLRGGSYGMKGLKDRSTNGDSVTVISKDPVKKAYAIADSLGRVSVVTKPNLLKLLKYHKVTNVVAVDGSHVRALPGEDIPEQSLELLSEINARNTRIGVWAHVSKRGVPVRAYYYYIEKNTISLLSASVLKINVNSGCRSDSLEFSDKLTPIRKDLVLGVDEIKNWTSGILIKQTYSENKPGFVYCDVGMGLIGNASFVPLEEVVGSLLLKKGKTYYAKYSRNKSGDLYIETLIDNVVLPKQRADSLCSQYELGYNSKISTENAVRIACSSDVVIDASGRLMEVKGILDGGSFIVPKSVNSIHSKAFDAVRNKISHLEILDNVKMVYDGNKPAYLRLYMNVGEIVVSSPYLLQDLNRISTVRPGSKLRLYGEAEKIGGWNSVANQMYSDVTVNNLHLGELPDNIQWNIVEDMKNSLKYQDLKDGLSRTDERIVQLKERKRKRGSITLRKSDVNAPEDTFEVEHIGQQMVYEVADIRKLDTFSLNYASLRTLGYRIIDTIKMCRLSSNVLARFEQENSEFKRQIDPMAIKAISITEGRVMYRLPWPDGNRVREIGVYHKAEKLGLHSLNIICTNCDSVKLGMDLQNGKRMSYSASYIKKYGIDDSSFLKAPAFSNQKSYDDLLRKVQIKCESGFINVKVTYDIEANEQEKAMNRAAEIIEAIKASNPSVRYIVTPKEDWTTNEVFVAFASGEDVIRCSSNDRKIYSVMFTGVENKD